MSFERVYAITAFGDIRGFGSWTSRAAVSREIKDPFMDAFYRLMDDYVLKFRDIHFKREGDGFMALKEIEYGKDEKKVRDFILTIRWITKEILVRLELVQEPLDGFVVRVFDGYVYKFMTVDGNDPERKRRVPEYVEYATNGASHLKEVNPEVLCLATKGVIKALGRHRSLFRVRPLGKPSCYPGSVNRVDLEALQIIQF